MKPFTVFIVFILTFILSCSKTDKLHIGEWKGTDKAGKVARFILDGDGYATLIIDGETIGGKDYDREGLEMEMRYEINYNKKPVWLDFIILEKGKSKEMSRLKGIVRFITDTQMEYKMIEGNGPRTFETQTQEETVILNKVGN